MQKQMIGLIVLLFVVSILITGCGKTESAQTEKGSGTLQSDKGNGNQQLEDKNIITPTSEIVSLEEGLAAVQFVGDYKLDEFLNQGGAFLPRSTGK